MPAIVAIPQVVEELLVQFGDFFPNCQVAAESVPGFAANMYQSFAANGYQHSARMTAA